MRHFTPTVSGRDHDGRGAAAASGVPRNCVQASPYGWPIGCQTFPLGKLIDQDFPAR